MEDQMQSFANIQRITLEVQERKHELTEGKEMSMAKKFELKARELEPALIDKGSRIMMADMTSLDPEKGLGLKRSKP
jgi:hypothetical protein